MRPIDTDGVSWSVTIMSHAKMAELIETLFGCGLGWPEETVSGGVQIPTCEVAMVRAEKWPTQDMPGHVQQSIYSK